MRVQTVGAAAIGVTSSNMMSACDGVTANFDGREYTIVDGPIGRNAFRYEVSGRNGLDDVIMQHFSEDVVYDLLYHINSLDQFGFWFDPAANDNIGWDIVSASDDAGNIGTGDILFLVDVIDTDQDTNGTQQQLDGDAGFTADATIRPFSTDSTLKRFGFNLRHIRQP